MVINKSDVSTPADLRRSHRGMVVSLIQENPGISRADIARRLGFSEMASTRIVRELLEVGIAEEISGSEEAPAKKKKLGRPKIGLRINGDGVFAAGITVSAYHSEVSICDGMGRIRARKEIAYLVSDDIRRTARTYGRELNRLIEESRIDRDRVVGVGVALAARTAPDENTIVRSDYFGWGNDGGAFNHELTKELGLPVKIDNIANALAAAERRFGAAVGVGDFVLIHVATVIGAAIVAGGQLVRGDNGISGMIGHFRSASTKHLCMCGRDDCLNLNATGFGVLMKLGKVTTAGFDPARLQDYASSLLEVVETEGVKPRLEDAGARLAPALDSVCKLLGPKKVILSGYVGANESFLHGLRDTAARDFGQEWFRHTPIVAGDISPTQAAALLALSTFCYSNQLDFERFAAVADDTPALRKA